MNNLYNIFNDIDDENLLLISLDNKKFKLSYDELILSNKLTDLYNNGSTTIMLNINSYLLEQLTKWLKLKYEFPDMEFNCDFINENRYQLLDLLIIADALEIDQLKNMICKHFARITEKYTNKELKKYLGTRYLFDRLTNKYKNIIL